MHNNKTHAESQSVSLYTAAEQRQTEINRNEYLEFTTQNNNIAFKFHS